MRLVRRASLAVTAVAGPLAAASVVASVMASASLGANVRYPGPRLAVVNDYPVYASFLNAPYTAARRSAICPRTATPLSARLVEAASTAVARAIPTLFARAERRAKTRGEHTLHIDTRDARATAFRSAGPGAVGTDFKNYCGELVWRRSIFVIVRLPHAASASQSQPSFHVARTLHAWVIWAEVH
jgi:hypothetical protein